jgi:hypothetical protein
MLSMKKGKFVAEIIDGKTKPKKVYLRDDFECDCEDEDDSAPFGSQMDEVIPKSFYTELRGISASGLLLLKSAIREGSDRLLGDKVKLLDAYRRAQAILKEIKGKQIILPKGKGHFEVVPQSESSRIFVGGPSGSGKSTWISNFLKQYNRKYPKNKIYIFSPVLFDEAFDGVKNLEYIRLDESVIDEQFSIKEFQDSACIFDDIETISNKMISEEVRRFCDQCLECGRHENITTVIVSHILLNGNITRRALNECDTVVFPKSNWSQIRNLCSRYYGFGRDDLSYLKDVKSRWAFIKKSYPVAVISEQAIKII